MGIMDHLVCDMRFNEGSGTITRGRSKNELVGTFGAGGEAPSWADGKWGIGKALSFDGGDMLTVNDLVTLLATLEVGAIEVWSKIDFDAGRQEMIFSITRDADAVVTALQFQYDTRTGKDRIELYCMVDDTLQWVASTPTDGITPLIAVYAHIVVVHDGTEAQVYINKLLVPLIFDPSTDKTAWFKALFTDATDKSDVATVGANRRNGSVSGELTGDVALLRIYDAVPTAQDVRAMYAEGLLNLKDGLVLDLDLSEGAGLVTRDESPSDNEGVVATSPETRMWVEGGGMLFDGLGDFINLGHPATLDWGTGDGTVEFWYEVGELDRLQQLVFANAGGGANGYGILQAADNTIKTEVYPTAGDRIVPSYDHSLAVGDLVCVHLVWDHDAGVVEQFINAIFKATDSGTTGAVTVAANAYIGSVGGASAFANMRAFRLRTWDRKLSNRELRESFEHGYNKSYLEREVVGEELAYGVEWNQNTDTWTRIDIDGREISPSAADFNAHPVWGSITRVNLADNGTVNAVYGGGGYESDGSNGEVMVRIPKFYVRGEQGAAQIYRWWISEVPMSGFELHPAFVQRGGTVKDYIHVGAYEASLMVGTGIHDNDTDLKLHSRSAEQPWTGGEIDALPYDTGSVEFTRGETITGATGGGEGIIIDWTVTAGAWGTNDATGTVYIKQQGVANFQAEVINGDVSGVAAATGIQVAEDLALGDARTYGSNRGAGWGQINPYTWSAYKLIFVIEYGNFDSQTEIGRGVVDLDAGVGFAGLETAAASIDDNLDEALTGVGTGADGEVPVTYRGIENPWGNIWKFVDGINIVDAEYRVIFKDGTGSFADPLVDFDASSMAPIETDGYIKDIEFDALMKYLFIASDTTGGSATYIPDRQLSHGAAETNILLSGGHWNDNSFAGLCAVSLAILANASGRTAGARSEYIA